MKRAAVCLALCASLATACVASASAGAARPCRSSDLRLALGPEVGEPTGRHTLVLTFTNRAKEPCGLDGYPVIVVRSTVRALPFEMRQAGDEVVTGARPRPVRVEARGRAYVVIDKYRCDARDRGRARRVVVQVPGAKAGERLTVPLPRDGSDFSFCGKGDPGSTISISPFEPSLTAALRRH